MKNQDPIDLILDERARQCQKGYDAKHDDAHTDGSILAAAEILIGDYIATYDLEMGSLNSPVKWVYQLHKSLLKKNRRRPERTLIIAAALLLAEIERLDRKARKSRLRGGSK